MGRQHPNILKIKKRRHKERRYYIDSKFNGIHVPRTVGQTTKPEVMAAVGFTQRFPRADQWDIWMNSVFLPDMDPVKGMKENWKYDAKEARDASNSGGKGWKRRYALSRAEEERVQELLEHEEAHNCITVKDSRLLCSRLTFLHNSKYTHCYFIETFYRPDGRSYMMKSVVYEGRDRAYFKMHHPSQIDWVEHVPLPSLVPVLPRSE